MIHRFNRGTALSISFPKRKQFSRLLVILSEAFVRRGGRMLSRRTAILLTLPLLAALALTACGDHKQPATASPEIVRNVALQTVQKTTVPDYVEATGTVHAAQSAQLASQVMGTITRVNVHEGDRVRRGEVLIAIDEAQQRAAYAGASAGLQASQETIAAADADYALAESTMKRYQMLYDKKSVSPQEFDEVKTKLAAAKARRDAAHAGRTQAEAGVSEASTAMAFTKIRAPFDGLVIAKLADVGAMATPGVAAADCRRPEPLPPGGVGRRKQDGRRPSGGNSSSCDRCARRPGD